MNPIDKADSTPAASFVGLLMHEKTNDDTSVIGSYALDYGQNTFIVNGDKNDSSQNKYYPDVGGHTIEVKNLEINNFADPTEFSSLDFVSTWEIDPNLGRPTLQENKESQVYTLISNADELNDIRNDLSGYYVLAADIDLDAYKAGSGWDPIGDGTEDPSSADQYPQAFKGILDGGANKHEIKI